MEFNPARYSKGKGFYEFWPDGGGYGDILTGTIYLIDATIPDKKAVFYKVDIKNASNYLAQKNF